MRSAPARRRFWNCLLHSIVVYGRAEHKHTSPGRRQPAVCQSATAESPCGWGGATSTVAPAAAVRPAPGTIRGLSGLRSLPPAVSVGGTLGARTLCSVPWGGRPGATTGPPTDAPATVGSTSGRPRSRPWATLCGSLHGGVLHGDLYRVPSTRPRVPPRGRVAPRGGVGHADPSVDPSGRLHPDWGLRGVANPDGSVRHGAVWGNGNSVAQRGARGPGPGAAVHGACGVG